MNKLYFLAGATAAFAALSVAPASAADCRSAIAVESRGGWNVTDARARACAQWGISVDGYDNWTSGNVEGPGTRVLTGSKGHGTSTHMDVRGYDNRVATVARSGGQISFYGRGNGNEAVLRGGNGSRVDTRIIGSGTYVRVEAD